MLRPVEELNSTDVFSSYVYIYLLQSMIKYLEYKYISNIIILVQFTATIVMHVCQYGTNKAGNMKTNWSK